MQRSCMTQRAVGRGMYKGHKWNGDAKKPSAVEKVPVWVPELKMTMYVLPGEDVAAKVARYKEQREHERGMLKGNRK